MVDLPERDAAAGDFSALLGEYPGSPFAGQQAELHKAWKRAADYLDREIRQDLGYEKDEEKIAALLKRHEEVDRHIAPAIADLIGGKGTREIYEGLLPIGERDEEVWRTLKFTLRAAFDSLLLDMPPGMHMVYEFSSYFDRAERRKKESPYTPNDIPQMEEAFLAAADYIYRHRNIHLRTLTDDDKDRDMRMLVEHEYPSTVCTYRDYIIGDIIEGEDFSALVEKIAEDYFVRTQPELIKYKMLLEAAPIFAEKMGLPVPPIALEYRHAKQPENAAFSETFRPDFSRKFTRFPESPLAHLQPEQLGTAFTHMMERLEELYQESVAGAGGVAAAENIKMYREVAQACSVLYARDLIAKGPEGAIDPLRTMNEFRQPKKWEIIQKIMPAFHEGLGLEAPAALTRPPAELVLIIDDSLEMDLKARNISSGPKDFFKAADKTVVTWHVKDRKGIDNVLAWCACEHRAPNAIICDYKLHRPGEDEFYGDVLLAEMLAKLEKRPEQVFLVSKSGFSEEDKQALRGSGITYAHAHELAAVAAYVAKDASNLELSTSMCTTSVLREWANAQFGMELPTGKWESPNVDEKDKGRVSAKELVERLGAAQVTQMGAYQLLDPESITAAFRPRVDARGVDEENKAHLPPGIKGPSFSGRLALSKEGVIQLVKDAKEEPILFVVAENYTPKHEEAVRHVDGLVLLKKGTQHIAVMARNKGIPVAFARGVDSAVMSVEDGVLYINDRGLERKAFAKEGDEVTFDGETLTLYKGKLPLVEPEPEAKAAVRKLAKYAENHVGLKWHPKVASEPDFTGVRVKINIDTAEDVGTALRAGLKTEGIGLIRSERGLHGNGGKECLQAVVFCEGEARTAALERFSEHQHKYFSSIFEEVDSRVGHRIRKGEAFPVTVRLLDPGPSEYFPSPEDKGEIKQVAERLQMAPDALERRVTELRGSNNRGATFGLAQPAIYAAQLITIFTAAKENHIEPEILVPNVKTAEQLEEIKAVVEETAGQIGVKYTFGAMLEDKAAVLTSEHDVAAKENLTKIINQCDFIRYGTNDLTESVLQLPRGDLIALAQWQHDNQKPFDPFTTLDNSVKDALERTTRFIHGQKPMMQVGLCGAQSLSHKDAAFFLDSRIGSISVPPTAEAITIGLINSGGAAMNAYTEIRERAAARITAASAKKAWAFEAPENTAVPYPKTLSRSPIAFVFVEDDTNEARGLATNLEAKPIVISPDISTALQAISSLREEGKRVVVITDMQVDFGDGASRSARAANHSWINDVGPNDKWGVALSNAIAEGEMQAVEPNDIVITSAGNPQLYGLKEGVKVVGKTDDFYTKLERIFESYEDSSRGRQEEQRGAGEQRPRL